METKKKFLNAAYAEWVYEALKVLPVLVFIYLALVWIDFFRAQKRKGTVWINRIAGTLVDSLSQNKAFIVSLGKPVATALFCCLGVQLVVNIYFSGALPVSYDEWWSYSHFSGRGVWYSLSRYPLPNNHVLYNVISSLFLLLPLDVELAIRMPSVLSSLICSYLLFKIFKFGFGNMLSLILLTLVNTSFFYTMYGFQGRGYSFLCLFTVLLMYATLHLLNNYRSSYKYRFYLILALVAGHLALPSFLYAAFTVLPVFGLQLLSQKRFSDFFLLVKDSVVSGILILASYSFILFFNDPEYLLNPNGGASKFKLDENGSLDKIREHYSTIGNYLAGFNYALLWIALFVVIIVFLNKRKQGYEYHYLTILSVFMLLSPLPIVAIHRVLPFERNWLYLIFPFYIGVGIVIKSLMNILIAKRLPGKVSFARNFVFILIGIVMAVQLIKFDLYYHRVPLEFEERQLAETELKPFLGKISKVAYTDVGFEFHVAHVIESMSFRESKNVWIEGNVLVTVADQDLLVIHSSRLSRHSSHLTSFKFVKRIAGEFNVFIRTSLL